MKDLEDFVEELNKIPILTAMQTNIIRTKVIRILSERRRKEREGKTESEVKKFVNNFTKYIICRNSEGETMMIMKNVNIPQKTDLSLPVILSKLKHCIICPK